ncbi:MAG: ribonuclease R [Rhodobacterales bacterium 12-64-8]|nr:MAG: ribonuclease R [Rhodobacterales bacterium 12-64-8]OYX47554.1 MAG: ribonuclease R [Alphaproteobacteria bacterium 32-64-14]
MSRPPRPPRPDTPPTREMVLDFLEKNPHLGAKRDIARGLDVSTDHKPELRRILNELEAEGALVRTAKRAFSQAEMPPPTGIVRFERIDRDGELIGRAMGKDGPFGPDIIYAGPSGANHRKGGPQLALGVGERALCRVEKGRDGVWRARAIKKVDATPETSLIGVYRANRHGGTVEPTSRKEKSEFIVEKSDARDAREGDLVRIQARPARGYGPRRANVTEVLGHIDDPRAASLIAMHTHGVPDEFPDAVIEEANKARPAQSPREDLTKIPLITIDPEDARDHDDAVYAEPDGHGGWRVIVAIADVSAYVRVGTALDREAYRRGNSTYFPDRVSPMLPEHLSADLCSLKEGELRETFAVEIFFNAGGHKTKHRFIRGKMRSAAKLSYRQAQDAIDGNPDDKTQPLLESVLKPLWEAYRTVSKARDQRAPLDLDLPERRVRIGQDGKIASISLRERFDAHRLIEEFMIQANVCAAETLEAKRTTLVYRVHEEPSEEKVNNLSNFLPIIGLKWTRGEKITGQRFNKLLGDVRGSENEHLVNEMVLRTQAQARYAHENLGHFGLNLAKYAHFTSPIRRYSDLIVHRALIRALDLGPDGMSDQDTVRLEEMAEHVTMTERRSMAAEREATERYLAIYMADRVGAVFDARIAGVNRAGLFVRLAENGADGFIPAARLSDEYWIHDDASAALVAQRSGQRYDMGMNVQVKLVEATPVTGGLLFSMQSPPRPRRNDLKMPSRDSDGRGPPRGPRSGPARKRPSDGSGRPPNIRHSTKPGGGGKPSYGKNKKPKGR